MGHANGKELQPHVVESLLVDTRRIAHKIFRILANSFQPESVERLARMPTTPLSQGDRLPCNSEINLGRSSEFRRTHMRSRR
jgi:hypothetical protein